SRPMRRSMLSATSMWNGSPPCDAQASASSAAPNPNFSATPSSTSGSAWSGLIAERANVINSGSPAVARSPPFPSATATLTTWCDSTVAPRLTSTRASPTRTPPWKKGYTTLPREPSLNRPVSCPVAPTRSHCSDQDARQQHDAAHHRLRARHFADRGQQPCDQRRTDGLTQDREDRNVRRQIAQRVVDTRVSDQHRPERERSE